MAVTVSAAALHGVDAIPIEIEVDLLRRLPSVCIVGLAAGAVKEAAERVRSAISSSALPFPRKRIVVNLAPAHIRKEGTGFDLPIALGILAADGAIPLSVLDGVLPVGELSLGGRVRAIRGALSFADLARHSGKTLMVPKACAAQAAIVPDVDVVGVDSLDQAVAWLRGEWTPLPISPVPRAAPSDGPDLREVRGQERARRALEIAAAGAHHVLLEGPPGCGKSMLAQRLPSILPPLLGAEALETTRVHSAAGLYDSAAVVAQRPFRAPHHSITVAGLIGDRTLRPGEISLAHNGVLFLDEAPEFPRSVLEVLRQPLEDGVVRVTRAAGSVIWPAAITLILAANPCPCGMRGSARPCGCTDTAVERYRRRLSGPVLDRIDLHIELEPVTPRDLIEGPEGEPSDRVRARVCAARERQHQRGQQAPNGRIAAASLLEHARLHPGARAAIVDGATRRNLSGRASTRLIRVARTIADLAAAPDICPEHVHEAFGLRVTSSEL